MVEVATFGGIEPEGPDGECLESCLREKTKELIRRGSEPTFSVIYKLYDTCRDPKHCDIGADSEYRQHSHFLDRAVTEGDFGAITYKEEVVRGRQQNDERQEGESSAGQEPSQFSLVDAVKNSMVRSLSGTPGHAPGRFARGGRPAPRVFIKGM